MPPKTVRHPILMSRRSRYASAEREVDDARECGIHDPEEGHERQHAPSLRSLDDRPHHATEPDPGLEQQRPDHDGPERAEPYGRRGGREAAAREPPDRPRRTRLAADDEDD